MSRSTQTFTRTLLPLLLLLVALTAGCATTKSGDNGVSGDLPAAASLPANATFGGAWYSNEFLHMYLVQNGSQVTGIYTFKNGGIISGVTEGNLLTFNWEEPGNKEEARRTLRGHGYLQLTKVGDDFKLNGKWGYDDSYDNGGTWTATYMRPLVEEDPVSLQDWINSGMEP